MKPIPRRTFLRGAGTLISLPLFDAMIPAVKADQAPERPVRLIWLYTKSGMWTDSFTPATRGSDYEMTPILKPLEAWRDQFSILSGLRHENAFKRNPIVNRHGQDEVCHLSAADLSRVPGVAAKNSISFDQLCARYIGEQTRLPTLNLTVAKGGLIRDDTGAALPEEHRPELVFDRLFGEQTQASKEEMERRFRRHKSILDDVIEQTATLNRKLGQSDRDKLDAYLSSVRQVERRLQIERKWAGKGPVETPPGVRRPSGVPGKRTDHVRIMLDLLVLALQTDQTRLATFKLGDMGCQFPEIGATDGYHGYTHGAWGNEPARNAMIKVDTHRIAQVAYLMEKLRAVPDGEHDLLRNCFIHYGSGMGKSHGEGEKRGQVIPNLVAGGCGGKLQLGQHIDYGNGEFQPLANLFVLMAQTAGIPIEKFVDSNEVLRV